MAIKPVTKEQNGQNVLVAFVPAQAISVENATLHEIILESESLPEPSLAVRKLIDSNPFKAFNLHKLVQGQIVPRTVEELEVSEFIDWNYNYSVAIAETEE